MKPRWTSKVAVGLIAMLALSGCASGGGAGNGGAGASANSTGYPLTIDNCGRQITIEKAPERVITGYQNTVELMIALGLEDKVVGRQPFKQSPLLPEQEAAFNAIPELTPGLPDNQQSMAASREVQLAARPDFVLASGSFEVNASRGVASIEDFKAAGAEVYILSAGDGISECGGQSTEELVYQDIRNLGSIFSVSDRAEALIDDLKAEVADVRSRIKDKQPVRLFAYDSGEGPFTSISNAYFDFSLAGAENVVTPTGSSLETYPEVSKEAVAGANPQAILTANYESGPLEDEARAKEDYLRTALPNSDAVIENRFIHIESIELSPGIRNARAVRQIATALHPDAFK